MRIKELIAELEQVYKEQGDLQVAVYNTGSQGDTWVEPVNVAEIQDKASLPSYTVWSHELEEYVVVVAT